MFQDKSYVLHQEWYDLSFPTEDSKIAFYHKTKAAGKQNMAYWLQQIFYNCLNPLLKEPGNWLTIGDAYGFDAQYILSQGSHALATDLSTGFLQVAQKQGIIKSHQAANAEKLPFDDDEFDYVLCKESYHHFPRPYAALYEMKRVARKGIIVIEPQDPISKMPLLLMLSNLLSPWSRLLDRVWKNRFSYEPVGNFVYKVSEREFEKFAAGLNLPLLAFKSINPNFYFKGANKIALNANRTFLIGAAKKWLRDTLVILRILPGQVLCTVIFKTEPETQVLKDLKAKSYRPVNVPKNPYL